MHFALTAFLGLFLAASGALADQCGPVKGTTGRFDYYLLSLSWSPTYCATPSGRGNTRQCGQTRPYGMVVHGLWPQYSDGSWPQCCRSVPAVGPSSAVEEVSKVMIGSGLLQHEWSRHGSCVEGGQDDYFGKINRVVANLGLAADLPGTGLERIKVSELKRNWAIPPQSITVRCKGRRLGEVHICLGTDLSPIPCPEAERKSDNCPGTVSLH